MSTRFVWNKSTIKWALSTGRYYNGYSVSLIKGIVDSSSAILSVDVYDDLSVDPNTGAISGVKTGTQSVTVQLSFGDDFYYLNPSSGNYFSPYVKVDGKTYYGNSTEDINAQNPSNRQYYLRNKSSNESGCEARLYYSTNRQSNYFSSSVGNCNPAQSGQAADEYVATVSNASSSTYPQDGVSGNYWYELQGSDNIDAASVGYSNQAPMGGQPITINVTAGTGKVYGGNVRYTYQVQLDNGAWTTIATNSTALSQSYTIPAGTTSFAARVQASDDLGFTSSSYTTGTTLTVTNNIPPSAPGSITIGSVVAGQSCTVSWTAATDSDGTVASYQLERQTDNGDTWTQIYSGPNLTYNDTIDTDWATVNYRVRAVDDDGDAGPYATGVMVTVNDGYLYFSGPAADMGAKPAPFNFIFSVGATIAGGGTVDGIAVTVAYDDAVIYDEAVTSAQQISLPIDTRLTYAGDHAIVVTAEKDGYLGFTQVCAFNVPDITTPEGGMAAILEDDEGNAIYPFTFARFVRGLGGNDINRLFDRVYSGTYTGTGTSGEGNPNRVRISFEPEAIFVQGAGGANYGVWVRTSAMGQAQLGSMIVHNATAQSLATVGWDAENQEVTWYAASAAEQLNTSGTQYGILILGGMA